MASNMISGEGLEIVLPELISNTSLLHLDLGVVESSVRKNSLGMHGAVCISSMLMRNQTLEYLCLDDNDFGPDGGECIGVALGQNETLKVLKLAENQLESTGAIPIIKTAGTLIALNLAKNLLQSDVGKPLSILLKRSDCIERLNLEYNSLEMIGTRQLSLGVSRSTSLKCLSVKANKIGDQGMSLLAASIQSCPSLIELDVSMNEIGEVGFQSLCEAIPNTNLQNLICCKNLLGDEILELFAQIIEGEDGQGGTQLRSFDLSSCRLNDQGLIYLINALAHNKQVNKIKLADNFFSEQIEATMLEILNKNMNLCEIGLQGNRFSHSCLAKIKQIF